jgi:hypothetical protein
MGYELGMGAVDRILYRLDRWLTKKPPKPTAIVVKEPALKQRPVAR